ncbi:MAG: uroporphyrinogen-III C-methyltransferase [Gallionella sp.]
MSISEPASLPPESPPPAAASPSLSVLPRLSVAEFFTRVSISQMTMALIVAVFLWQWLDGHQTLNGMQQELAKKIAEMDGTSKANQLLLTRSQEEVRELSSKLVGLEARYAEAQSQRAALESLYRDLSSSRDETALAEVEQLLMIATQQLQLSSNIKAALIALQSADARLERMNLPALAILRKSIGNDIAKLRASPDVDLPALSARLDNLIVSVGELPLVYQPSRSSPSSKPATAHESTWKKLLAEIWYEAKQLIRIENTGKAEIPLLPPSQEFFLRENLKLRLLTARLALLAHDDTNFKQELKTVQHWTTRYFDTQSPITGNWLAEHQKLAATSLNIELPDLDPSLQAVRNYRLSREKAAR